MVMNRGLANLNNLAKGDCLVFRNDHSEPLCYLSWMRRPHHDWYLKEWLRTLGRTQADIVRDLDWNKAKISLMVSGKQQYNRDAINELASYLNLRPHELLLHPEDAMAIRRWRETALQIAAESRDDEDDDDLPLASNQ